MKQDIAKEQNQSRIDRIRQNIHVTGQNRMDSKKQNEEGRESDRIEFSGV